MKIRFASALLALALPLAAQEPVASETEAIFYKAFYLEKGPRDFAGAMALYEQFLAKAPEHKLAAEAAKQQYMLLDKTGKTKERDAFKAKYEKLIGNLQPSAAGDAAGGNERGAARGEGRGEGRGDPAARVAELEKQLAKAKEAGDEEQVKRLTAQIERMKQGGGDRARGPGGRGGLMAAIGDKKVADMSAEEVTKLKEAVAQSSAMIERMRERNPDMADKLATNVDALKKALDANNMADAQKAIDALREAMPRPREGGGRPGGGAGGPGGGGAGGGNNCGGR